MPENDPMELLDLASLSGFDPELCLRWPRSHILAQGENAHQKAALYGELADYFKQVKGPLPSFTAIQDLVAGLFLMGEFEKAAIAVLKQGHIVGTMVGMSLEEAWAQWLAGSTTQAGSVFVLNRTVDAALLELLIHAGAVVLLAPGYTPGAIEWAAREAPQASLVQMAQLLRAESLLDIRLLPFGALVQERERFTVSLSGFCFESSIGIPSNILEDIIFAWKCAKHARSFAAIIAHKETTLGMSTGQLSGRDAWLLACSRAKEVRIDVKGAVFATDTPCIDQLLIEELAKEGLCALVASVSIPEQGNALRELASGLGLWFIEARKTHFRL